MKLAKVIATLLLVALSVSSTYAALPEVSCDTDPAFSGNACNQCFDGGSVSVGDNLGLLTDDLLNDKSGDIIVYKEEQEFPELVSLSSDVSWSQTPSGDGFWKYTDAFNNLYSESEDGYIVPSGSEVTWLESTLGYAYTLDSNNAPTGSNVGLLVYKLISHDISADGDITIEGESHNECVLFTSGDTPTEQPPVVVEQPKQLPETGAEHILLILLALLLGFGFLKFMRRA
jgi:LPXTG-motif cell wall-anchored protein